MSDERDKPHPGAVPQAFSPQQVTAPLALGHPSHATNPWGIPPYLQPPPPEPKKDRGGLDLAFKIIGLAITVSTIIFGAGALSEKLKHIEENQKAADGMRAEEKQQQHERDRGVMKAIDRLGQRVDDLSEQFKQTRTQRHDRRREDSRGVDPRP